MAVCAHVTLERPAAEGRGCGADEFFLKTFLTFADVYLPVCGQYWLARIALQVNSRHQGCSQICVITPPLFTRAEGAG